MSLSKPVKGFLLLVVIIVVFTYLDSRVTYSIQSNKMEYSQEEIINITVSVKNRYPFPILYSGYNRIKVTTHPELPTNMTAAQAAKEASSRASEMTPRKIGACFLWGSESKILRNIMVKATNIRDVTLFAKVEAYKTSYLNYSCKITEFSPIWVEHNSTGITMFADIDEKLDYPKIGVFIRNDNLYPVRLPSFDYIEVHYGSPDSNYSMGIYYDLVYSHFDIPALSTRRIFSSFDVRASEDRPVFYKIYGVHVRYPPED